MNVDFFKEKNRSTLQKQTKSLVFSVATTKHTHKTKHSVRAHPNKSSQKTQVATHASSLAELPLEPLVMVSSGVLETAPKAPAHQSAGLAVLHRVI